MVSMKVFRLIIERLNHIIQFIVEQSFGNVSREILNFIIAWLKPSVKWLKKMVSTVANF